MTLVQPAIEQHAPAVQRDFVHGAGDGSRRAPEGQLQGISFVADKSQEKAKMRLLRAALWLAALMPALWLASEFRGLPQLGDFHDDAMYLVSAKSLAEGRGHRILSLPGEPHQTKYPPLFPAWLATAWRANPDFPANLPWFLVLAWVWLPALALVSRTVFRDLGFEDRWALGLSAALMLVPLAAYFAVSLMAELMMATLLMVALALAERGRALASGLAAALAFLVKSAALPAFIAVPALYAFRGQYRRAALFAIPAWTCFFAWIAWTGAHRDPGAAADYYIDYIGFHRANHSLADLPELVATNIPIAIMGAGRLLAFDSQHTGSAIYLATLLGLLSLLSFARIPGRLTMYHAFLIGFLPMLLVWNFTPHERFWLPVLPLLLAGLAAELRRILRLSRWMRPVALAFAATLLWMNLGAIFTTLPSIAESGRRRNARLAPVYAWIREHTPPDAAFAAAVDPVVYLHTGRHARGMHFPTRFFYHGDRAQILDYFAKVSAFAREHALDWALILDEDHAMDLTPAETRERASRAQADPALELAASFDRAKVFRVRATLEENASPHPPRISAAPRPRAAQETGHP
jgi:hypothetical protein